MYIQVLSFYVQVSNKLRKNTNYFEVMGIVCAFFGLPLEPQKVFDSLINTIKHLHFGIQKLNERTFIIP